ncbi:hypothetical protein DER46DRAFT_154873 [Fusarium sp. MPI-SDFR-AT-0072]|nr:hypothetical protein DER46DRAFT_154873 [Fusarium sp. MPI-SDFR-AT-0072]
MGSLWMQHPHPPSFEKDLDRHWGSTRRIWRSGKQKRQPEHPRVWERGVRFDRGENEWYHSPSCLRVAGKARIDLCVVQTVQFRYRIRMSTCSNNLGCMTVRSSHTHTYIHIGLSCCLGFLGPSNHGKLQDQSNIMMNYIGLCRIHCRCIVLPSEHFRKASASGLSTTGPGSRARRDRAKQSLLTSLSLLFPSPPSYSSPCQFYSRLPHVAQDPRGARA